MRNVQYSAHVGSGPCAWTKAKYPDSWYRSPKSATRSLLNLTTSQSLDLQIQTSERKHMREYLPVQTSGRMPVRAKQQAAAQQRAAAKADMMAIASEREQPAESKQSKSDEERKASGASVRAV